MKKYAEIKYNLVENIIKVNDDFELPEGCVDVTNMPCDTGWPIVDGVPKPPPSSYHTVNSDCTGWELTEENKNEKDKFDSDCTKANLQNIDSKSIRSIREFLVKKFPDDPDMPVFLKDYELEAEAEREGLI